MNYIQKFDYVYRPYVDITKGYKTNALSNIPEGIKQPYSQVTDIKKGINYINSFETLNIWNYAETYEIEDYEGERPDGVFVPLIYYIVLYKIYGNDKWFVNSTLIDQNSLPIIDTLKISQVESLLNLDLTPQEIVV